ncbi:MAG: DUF262 domain-containing protein [Deltaproteobacteria bacterium]|nr:DUF262 domain-containing protein [Deltaproteobacteria bacterium]
MIDYQERALGELFEAPLKGEPDSYFQVPRPQRKFEWEREVQIAALLDDFFENLGRPYFMGPIALYYKTDCKDVEIVDGQQRLATFAIFYRAFVDYVQKRRNDGGFEEDSDLDKEVEKLQRNLQGVVIKSRMKQVVAIQLSKTLNDFFLKQIMLDEDENKIDNIRKAIRGQSPSIKKLGWAYIEIFETLASKYNIMTGNNLYKKLKDVSDSLRFQQMFLAVGVKSRSDAYTIFETINERGKKLTTGGLVKNLCFSRLPEMEDEAFYDEFEEQWEKAEKAVSNFSSFIWHVWVSQNDPCPKSKVFKEIEDKLKIKSGNEVWDFAARVIFEEAPWYNEYENPHEGSIPDKYSEDRNKYLKMLRNLHASRCYPLLLGIDYSAKKEKNITPEQANELLKAITCLTFWYSGVCVKDAKNLEPTYHSLAKEIRSAAEEEAQEVFNKIQNRLHKEFPTPSECWGSFSTKAYSDEFKKMLLRNIEEAISTEKTLKSNKHVWLEHILPQKPEKDSDWMQIFPDENRRKEYTERIGNCTLLSEYLNIEAKNKPFIKKRDTYIKSQIILNTELANIEKWDANAIDERTKRLFDLAKQVFPIPIK